MNLTQELAKGEYAALSNADKLTAVLAVASSKKRLITSARAVTYLAGTGALQKLYETAADTTNQVFPLAKATVLTLEDSGGNFNVDPSTSIGATVIGSLYALSALGFLTDQQRDAFLALGTQTTYPFAGATLADVEAALLNVYTETEVTYQTGSIDVIRGRSDSLDITVSLASIQDKPYGFRILMNATTDRAQSYDRYDAPVKTGVIPAGELTRVVTIPRAGLRAFAKYFIASELSYPVTGTVRIV